MLRRSVLLRASLVCVVAPDEAARIEALGGDALDDEIERRSHSILGKVQVEPGHGMFPLGIETAHLLKYSPLKPSTLSDDAT